MRTRGPPVAVHAVARRLLRLVVRVPQQLPHVHVVFAVREDVGAVMRVEMAPDHGVRVRLQGEK